MIFFLYGPDDYRARQKINELKQKFHREVDSSGSSSVELEPGWSLSDWHDLSAADSLFARRRLIVAGDFLFRKDKDFLTQFQNSLTGPAVDNHVVILYEPRLSQNKKKDLVTLDSEGREKALTKAQRQFWDTLNGPYSQFFPQLNTKELQQWIGERLAVKKLKISYPAAQKLITAAGDDLWLLANELDKIIAYKLAANNGELISSEEVALLSVAKTEQSIFALMDALSNKNHAEAVHLLEELFESGGAEAYISTMVLRQAKILVLVKDAVEKGDTPAKIASKLKIHPYVCQKAINQCRNFSLNELRQLLDKALLLDAGFKSGSLNYRQALSILAATL